MSFLLISPPVTKPGEPPAGLAKLSSALAHHGIACRLLDANLEGLLHLMGQSGAAADTWSRRALKHLPASLAALRTRATVKSFDGYTRAVSDTNRVLAVASRCYGARVSLADYHDARLSPVRSADLLQAAGHPEQNAFYTYFSSRLSGLLDAESFSVIGLSLNFLSQALTTFAMIGFLRRQRCRVKLVLGGGLITSWMRRPGFKNPFAGLVDLLIDG
ncbi:MAG: radical SAM protein, partial [Pseudomonadota bacterium]